MVLIALLVALSVERVYQAPAFWHVDFYLQRWLDWSLDKVAKRGYQQRLQHSGWQLVWLLLPAVAAGVLISVLDHGLVTFIASIMVLLLCMNCQPARAAYKGYLQAVNRNQQDEAKQYQQQLQHWAGVADSTPVNQLVCWINYQQYLAVVFYFLFFGVFGALAYASIQLAAGRFSQRFDAAPMTRLRWAVDFIPVRIAAFGLLIVGHFSRALPTWLSRLGNVKCSSLEVLCSVAERAEDVDHHQDDHTEVAAEQLKLMKRQQLLWLGVIALLTLGGGLY